MLKMRSQFRPLHIAILAIILIIVGLVVAAYVLLQIIVGPPDLRSDPSHQNFQATVSAVYATNTAVQKQIGGTLAAMTATTQTRR